MAEENASETTEQAIIETTTETPTSMVGADGHTFVDGWQKQLTDESLREDQTLATIKDIDTWAKNHVHLRKQVPMDKMPRPNENFTDSDWEEFHKAGGRPDTPQGFNIKRHEKISEEMMPKDMIEGYQNLFHKIGLSKKQVDAIVAHNDELTLMAIQNQTQSDELAVNTRNDALHQLWGSAYEQKKHLGNIAIDKGYGNDFTDEDKEWLVKHVNDPKNATLLKWASNLGKHFSEHGIIEDSNIPTPADHDTKIREAQGLNISDSAERAKHPYWNAKHPQHERQIKLVQQLIEAKTKSKKVS